MEPFELYTWISQKRFPVHGSVKIRSKSFLLYLETFCVSHSNCFMISGLVRWSMIHPHSGRHQVSYVFFSPSNSCLMLWRWNYD